MEGTYSSLGALVARLPRITANARASRSSFPQHAVPVRGERGERDRLCLARARWARPAPSPDRSVLRHRVRVVDAIHHERRRSSGGRRLADDAAERDGVQRAVKTRATSASRVLLGKRCSRGPPRRRRVVKARDRARRRRLGRRRRGGRGGGGRGGGGGARGRASAGGPGRAVRGSTGGALLRRAGARAAPRSAEVDEGESGDWPVGVAGSAGACSGRPALASSSRFRT